LGLAPLCFAVAEAAAGDVDEAALEAVDAAAGAEGAELEAAAVPDEAGAVAVAVAEPEARVKVTPTAAQSC
jgi:hypothetical protein